MICKDGLKCVYDSSVNGVPVCCLDSVRIMIGNEVGKPMNSSLSTIVNSISFGGQIKEGRIASDGEIIAKFFFLITLLNNVYQFTKPI